jgi:hypothetical protein
MGEAMPKMSSKVTMKIEPKLLQTIQMKAESEGLPVSSYIRKAVISYIGERQDDNPMTISFEMTPLEIRAISHLRSLGVVRYYEEVFHNAFDLYLRSEYDNVVSRAKDLLVAEVVSNGPFGKESSTAKSLSDLEVEDNIHFDDEEGDVDN